MGGIVVRSFAEALRKALQAQILRQPDMEVGAIDIPTDSEPQVRHPNFEHVKLGDGVLVTPLAHYGRRGSTNLVWRLLGEKRRC